MFTTYGNFSYPTQQRNSFIAGDLAPKWKSEFPDIFDDDDLRLAITQAKFGYHFHEWLAATIIYREQGMLSLIQKYGCKNHPRKLEVLAKLIHPEKQAILSLPFCKSHPPDLLVYSRDYSDYFFCEVKGPHDKIRPGQEAYFAELEAKLNKPVQLIYLRRE